MMYLSAVGVCSVMQSPPTCMPIPPLMYKSNILKESSTYVRAAFVRASLHTNPGIITMYLARDEGYDVRPTVVSQPDEVEMSDGLILRRLKERICTCRDGVLADAPSGVGVSRDSVKNSTTAVPSADQ